jgi:hypothetical protein
MSKDIQIFKTCLIMVTLLIICSFLSPYVNAGIFGECNYYECILDKMPGVENDVAAYQISRVCSSKCTDMSEKNKTSFGFSGKMTASKCAVKYAKKTQSEVGARIITRACYSLYPKE